MFVAGSGYAHCADFSGFAAIFRRHCQMHLACRKVGGFGCQLFMHFSPFQINSRVIRDDHEGHSCSCSMPSEMLPLGGERSEEHTSELPSLMRTSYAVFCLKKKKTYITNQT